MNESINHCSDVVKNFVLCHSRISLTRCHSAEQRHQSSYHDRPLLATGGGGGDYCGDPHCGYFPVDRRSMKYWNLSCGCVVTGRISKNLFPKLSHSYQ